MQNHEPLGGWPLLGDPYDPTVALFISEGAASKASALVLRKYPDRVSKTQPKIRHSRGEIRGYQLIIHFKDKRPSSPLTNGDFERLH